MCTLIVCKFSEKERRRFFGTGRRREMGGEKRGGEGERWRKRGFRRRGMEEERDKGGGR